MTFVAYKKLSSVLMTGLMMAALMGALASPVLAGSVVIQVELETSNGDRCSLLEISPTGELTELASQARIWGTEVSSGCDFNDVGMTAGPDGRVYYSDDTQESIRTVDASGELFTLVSEAALNDLIGETNDIDSGMVFGQDGNLYVADEDCNCVIRVNLGPDGVTVLGLEIVVTEGTLAALADPDLEGGMVRMPDGTLYITNDTDQGIFRVTPDGTATLWVDFDDFSTQLGYSEVDLDVGMTAVGDTLYVMDDDHSGLVAIDTATATLTELFNDADLIEAVDGPGSPRAAELLPGDDAFSVEGGLTYFPDRGTVILPIDDSALDYLDAYVMEMALDGSLSVFVDNDALTAFYSALYPNFQRVDFNGSATYRAPSGPVSVDTTSPWALWVLVLALMATAGVVVGRRV